MREGVLDPRFDIHAIRLVERMGYPNNLPSSWVTSCLASSTMYIDLHPGQNKYHAK
jgi:hypothetical protein